MAWQHFLRGCDFALPHCWALLHSPKIGGMKKKKRIVFTSFITFITGAFILFLHKPCHQASQKDVGREELLVVLTVWGPVLSVLDVG